MHWTPKVNVWQVIQGEPCTSPKFSFHIFNADQIIRLILHVIIGYLITYLINFTNFLWVGEEWGIGLA